MKNRILTFAIKKNYVWNNRSESLEVSLSVTRIFCYRSIRSLKTLFPTNLRSLRKFRQLIQTKATKNFVRLIECMEDTGGPSIKFSCLLNCVSYFHKANSDISCPLLPPVTPKQTFCYDFQRVLSVSLKLD